MRSDSDSSVLIEGDGIAAVCIARLLLDAGVRICLQANPRPKLATILLTPQTQQLLRSIFPVSLQHPTDLLDGFPTISSRVVRWGSSGAPVALPHSGLIAPEEELLRRLWSRVDVASLVEGKQGETAWSVQTNRRAGAGEQSYGNLQAHFATVELKGQAAQESCWVESVANGWLFLLCLGDNRATLIAVGDTTDALLASSHLVGNQLRGIVTHHAAVPSHPRISGCIADSHVIACGSAAMSFDPLCGEGAGHAVREAFLAAAVIRASLQGYDRDSLARHYAGRLRMGFLRHLQTCLQFYSTGGSSSFWTEQAITLGKGIASLQQEMDSPQTMQFRLVDRDLLPVERNG